MTPPQTLLERIQNGRATAPTVPVLVLMVAATLSCIFSWVATGHCTFFTYEGRRDHEFSVGLYSAKVDGSVCVRLNNTIGMGFRAGRAFGIWANICVMLGYFMALSLSRRHMGRFSRKVMTGLWAMAAVFHLLTFSAFANSICDKFECHLGTAGGFNGGAMFWCGLVAWLCTQLPFVEEEHTSQWDKPAPGRNMASAGTFDKDDEDEEIGAAGEAFYAKNNIPKTPSPTEREADDDDDEVFEVMNKMPKLSSAATEEEKEKEEADIRPSFHVVDDAPHSTDSTRPPAVGLVEESIDEPVEQAEVDEPMFC